MTASARFLAIALGLGLLLRLGLSLLAAADPSILMHHDQMGYIHLAETILTGGGLGPAFGAERVPGYPLWLALCGIVAPGGAPVSASFGTHALVLAVVGQQALGLVAVYAVYRAGRLIDQTTANLAGGFAALNLNMAVYSGQILTDALFYPLFAVGLFLFLLYRESRRRSHLALLSAVLGAATMIRTVTMFAPLFLVPYLLLERGVGRLGERAVRAGLFALIFLAFTTPWLARNQAVFGHAAMTTQGQPHIVSWVIPGIAQYEEGLALDTATKKYTEAWAERVAALPQDEQADPFALEAESKAWFWEYLGTVSPVSVVKAWFWGAVKNLFTPVSVELGYIFRMDWTHFYDTPGAGFPEQAWNFVAQNKNRLYAALLAAGILLTLAFRATQLAGAWRLARSRPGILVGGVLVMGYFLAVSGPVGYAKYRLPYEPFFALLTGLAVAGLPALRREAASGPQQAPTLRRMAGPALRALLAGGCVLYVLWGLDLGGLARAVAGLSPWGLAAMAGVVVLDYLSMGLRLNVISQGRTGLVGGINAGLLGLGANNVFPAKLGEAAKILYMARLGRVGLGQSLGWVFWERFGDLNLLVACGLAAALATGSGAVAWPVAAVAALIWGGLALLARWEGCVALVERLVPFAGPRRLAGELSRSLRTSLGGGFPLRVLASSALVWSLYFLQYVAMLLLAAGLDLTWSQCLVVFVMAAGGMAMPTTPGGVGVYEAVLVAALALFGVPREQALAVGLVYHMFLYIPSTLYALALLARGGLSLGELRGDARGEAGAEEASHG